MDVDAPGSDQLKDGKRIGISERGDPGRGMAGKSSVSCRRVLNLGKTLHVLRGRVGEVDRTNLVERV